MTIIIDGKKIRDEILAEVKQGIADLPFTPIFCDIMVGNDPVSLQYVRMKAKTAEQVGIGWHDAVFPKDITTDALITEIKKLNAEPHMSGLIIQLPLPPHIDKQKVLDAIDPAIDVDCLGAHNSSRFYDGEAVLSYPTALACVEILERLDVDFKGKRFVVLGQGELVGRPVTHLLRQAGISVDTITRATQDQAALLKNADVIISGIGEAHFLHGDMIKPGAIVIDAGTSETTHSVAGDADTSVVGVAGMLSPVPGGVGPVTVAMLLRNVLVAAQHKK